MTEENHIALEALARAVLRDIGVDANHYRIEACFDRTEWVLTFTRTQAGAGQFWANFCSNLEDDPAVDALAEFASQIQDGLSEETERGTALPKCQPGHAHPMNSNPLTAEWECPVDPEYRRAIRGHELAARLIGSVGT